MTDDDPVKYLYDTAGKAYSKFGMSTTLPAELEPYLRKAGFENIHCQIMKVRVVGKGSNNENCRPIPKNGSLGLSADIARATIQSIGYVRSRSRGDCCHGQEGLGRCQCAPLF